MPSQFSSYRACVRFGFGASDLLGGGTGQGRRGLRIAGERLASGAWIAPGSSQPTWLIVSGNTKAPAYPQLPRLETGSMITS